LAELVIEVAFTQTLIVIADPPTVIVLVVDGLYNQISIKPLT